MAWYEKPTVLSNINKDKNYVFLDESGDIKDFSKVISKINKGVKIESRDSNFVITAIYTGARNLSYMYASLCSFKEKHFGDHRILHTTDIFNKNDLYIPGTSTPRSDFIEELDELIDGFRFKVVATAFNKVRYVKKHKLNDSSKSSDIIKMIYKREFLKIEKMLVEMNKTATFVIEESSNPKMDKMILNVFVELRMKKRLINSESLYFTKKSAKCYPAGTEIVDFASRAIYSFYKNIEFVETAKKVYDLNLVYCTYLEFFDKEPKE